MALRVLRPRPAIEARSRRPASLALSGLLGDNEHEPADEQCSLRLEIIFVRPFGGVSGEDAVTTQKLAVAPKIPPTWGTDRDGRDRVDFVLSPDQLRTDVETGRDRHGDRRLHRHAGPADGEAPGRGVLPRGARRRAHEVEGCNYLLALEMEMDPRAGLRDGELGARLRRLRAATRSRQPAPDPVARGPPPTLLCGVQWHGGSPVAASPRQVLKAQLEKAAALGYDAMFGSELEFFLFRESYEEAHAKQFRDLTPSVPYILDYHILAASYDEPFLREVRTAMKAAGLKVESSKGEAWPGQHEINFRFADALKAADDHVIYKTGAKELAPVRDVRDVHGEAGSQGSRLVVPHPLVALAGRRGCVRRRVGGVQAVPRRADRVRGGARDLPGADDQLVQALRRRQLGADDARVGHTTTAPAASASSGTARRCARRRASPAPTRTRTSRSRRCSPRGCTASSRSSSSGQRSRATRTSPTSERFPHALRDAIARSSRARSRAHSSATR